MLERDELGHLAYHTADGQQVLYRVAWPDHAMIVCADHAQPFIDHPVARVTIAALTTGVNPCAACEDLITFITQNGVEP